MNVTFETVKTSEIDVLLPFIAALYMEDGGTAINEEFSRKAVESLLANPPFGSIWFICVDGKQIGYLCVCLTFSLEYGGQDAIIDELYVEPEYRGMGGGTKAVEFSEQYCRENGVNAVHLEVYDGNQAIELYKRLGFETHASVFMTKWLK